MQFKMAESKVTITVNIPQLDDLRRLIEHLELVIAQTPQANIELEHEHVEVKPVVETKKEEPQPETMSLEAVQKVMYETVKKHGKDAVKGILEKFGASKVSAVAPGDRSKLAEELQKLGGEG